MKKGVIFDMDGTIWNSAKEVADSWNLVMEQHHRKLLTAEDLSGVMGLPMDRLSRKLIPDLTPEKAYELMMECCIMQNAYLAEHGAVLYPNLEETLQMLAEKYPLYIVSNCECGYIEAFLEHYGFEKYFQDIQCFGANKKQKGENIRLVADRNQLTDAVYVGDIQGDYDASREAGVQFIHAAYGFGTIKEKTLAIQNFSELPEMVERVFEG